MLEQYKKNLVLSDVPNAECLRNFLNFNLTKSALKTKREEKSFEERFLLDEITAKSCWWGRFECFYWRQIINMVFHSVHSKRRKLVTFCSI